MFLIHFSGHLRTYEKLYYFYKETQLLTRGVLVVLIRTCSIRITSVYPGIFYGRTSPSVVTYHLRKVPSMRKNKKMN